MAERMFGMETEYAVVAFDADGSAVSKENFLRRLMARGLHTLKRLPDMESPLGFFLPGGRLYCDVGLHPEFATAEATDPWEAVSMLRGGERALARLVEEAAADAPGVARASLLRCNVDYSGSHATRGCHESYLNRAAPDALPAQLSPHLVSRIIYTGAGGFDPTCAGALFVLSPRAAYVKQSVSCDTMHSRGVFNTKDEPLCGKGYHRLHVILGESVCSDTAAWLKVGTTALVVAMIEAGANPGSGVRMRSAVAALNTFAKDCRCTAAVPTEQGPLTALKIQRHYLERAESCLGAAFMPGRAEEVCRLWRRRLDELENGPVMLSRTLDWAIKQDLYSRRCSRRGFDWNVVPVWAQAADSLRSALNEDESGEIRLTAEVVRAPNSPIRREIDRLARYYTSRGLNWNQLNAYLRLRDELFVLDSRFGEAKSGVFDALDRQDLLDHRVDGVPLCSEGMHVPRSGRGRVRAEFVLRLPDSQRDQFTCSWSHILDESTDRMLDLTDPWEGGERWRDQRPLPQIVRRLPGFRPGVAWQPAGRRTRGRPEWPRNVDTPGGA